MSPVLPGELRFEPGSPVKLVIGYEDLPTGHRAMKSCQRLIERLGPEFEFRTAFWNFDVLRAPKLKDMAAHDVAEADVVVISAHGARELPSEVKSWMEGLSERKRGGGKALIALLDGVEGGAAEESQAHSYLQGIAEKADFDFFSYQCSGAEPAHEFSPSSLAARAEATSQVLEKILHQPVAIRDWGINE